MRRHFYHTYIAGIFSVFILFTAIGMAFADDAEMYKADFACAQKLQEALRKGDRQAVAALIDYPVPRGRPLPPINSEQELIGNWDDFFNDKTIASIIDEKPEIVGWRGVMLGQHGEIWFSNGKIDGINMRTEAFKKKFARAREEEYKILHSSARGYKQIELECDTPTLHVRIQEHDDGTHYFTWKKGSVLLDKPAISLKGTWRPDGSGGSREYTFVDDPYLYQIFEPGICGEDCNIHLTVFKGEETISDEVCEYTRLLPAEERQPKNYHRPESEAEIALDTILSRNADEKNWDVYGFIFNYSDSRKKQGKGLAHLFTKAFLDKSEKEEKALITESCGGHYPENGRPCDMIRSVNPIACAQDNPDVYLYRTVFSDKNTATIAYTWSGTEDGPTYRMAKEGLQWKLDATSCDNLYP